MAYFAYNLLLAVTAVVLAPYSLFRGWKRGQPSHRLKERLGRLPRLFQQTSPGSIWLHAVSVGEVSSCLALLRELRRRFPGAPLFVSTGTATGQNLAAEKLTGTVDGIFYAPLDLSFAVRRVLRRLQPQLVLIAETEIWPNLFRETKRAGAGLLVVNGRISDQTAASYQRFRFFFREVLQFPDAILAQSAVDRERFIAAGASEEKVRTNGNFKYDFEPNNTELPAEVAEFLARTQPRPLLVAGSTREDEEQPLIEAFRRIARSQPRALLVVAPRHPQRFDEVAALLDASGIPHVRRSRLGPDVSATLELPAILLLDTLGELAALYRAAHVVFVGGSLNGWGGHNVLEPALYGRPVVVGPHMQNFREIADSLLSQGGMVRVSGAEELAPALLRLVENPAEAEQLGRRGRAVAESQRGATLRTAADCEGLYWTSAARYSPSLWRRILLAPLAAVWEAVALLRLAGYRQGWFGHRRLSAFTICVGNLTAGGAGKTPTVAWLAERLSRRGHKPSVLTRGYRRAWSNNVIARAGQPVRPQECGDEAVVLLRHFRRGGLDVPLGIGAGRFEVGEQLLDSGPSSDPPNVVLLDDGFQHLKLARDFDLVLVDATNPFGGGMLPLGRLREPETALERAGAILLTRTEPGRAYDELEQRLRALNPEAPIFRSWTRTVSVVDVASRGETPIEALAGKRVVAFCGLGNPESFWRGLRRQGICVVERFAFRDHHRYSAADVRRILHAAETHRADLVLTTEKDLVNLAHASAPLSSIDDLDPVLARTFRQPPLHWLKIETVVEQEDELLQWIETKIAGRNRSQPRESVAQGAQV